MARGPFSGAQSNTRQSGVPQGTPGGRARPMSFGFGSAMQEVGYLWILVITEVLLMGYLRKQFRRHHGG